MLGCGIPEAISGSADVAVAHLDAAIATLSQQSADWQTTLTTLERQLTEDARATIANEVQQLAERGISRTGVELRCNADFIRDRMKQGLEGIKARLLGRTPPKVMPALCQVSPSFVDMNNLPGQLEYFGYDLDRKDYGPVEVFLVHDGGRESLAQWTANPTLHYHLTVDIASAPLCNKKNRKIVLLAGTTVLSTINVSDRRCPAPPPPPQPLPARLLWVWPNETVTGGLGGASFDKDYDAPLHTGYVRQQFRVTRTQGAGDCYADRPHPRDPSIQLGWLTSDPKDPRFRVHFGAAPFQGAACYVELWEVGEQLPPPPPPPCPCR